MKLYTAMIPEYAALGKNDKDWYIQCRETLAQIFPREDLWLICRLLAATSIHTSLKANIVLFKKALFMYHNGLPFEGFVPVMHKQLVSLRHGGDLSGRKIRNFAAAMYGDVNAVVVDTWILRAFSANKQRTFRGRIIDASADTKTYDAIEKWIIKRAIKLGLKPRELCSMIWAGVRRYKGYYYEPTRYCQFIIQSFTQPLLFSKEEMHMATGSSRLQIKRELNKLFPKEYLTFQHLPDNTNVLSISTKEPPPDNVKNIPLELSKCKTFYHSQIHKVNKIEIVYYSIIVEPRRKKKK